MDIKQIAIGMINSTIAKYGNPNKKVEELAIKRLEVCLGSCKEYHNDKLLGKRCDHCNCVLSWLSRSAKTCKQGKWDNL
jgi:hypothetical protein